MEVRAEAKKYVEVLEKWETTLNNCDDPNFWKTAVSILMTDAEYDIGDYLGGQNIYLEVGSCSHWLRPHQTRWKADGGFAWPSGYGSTSFSLRGLPELD